MPYIRYLGQEDSPPMAVELDMPEEWKEPWAMPEWWTQTATSATSLFESILGAVMMKSEQERAAELELQKARIEAEGKARAQLFDFKTGKISPWLYVGIPAGLIGLFLILRR